MHRDYLLQLQAEHQQLKLSADRRGVWRDGPFQTLQRSWQSSPLWTLLHYHKGMENL